MRVGVAPEILPAWDERLRLAAERGHDGDDPGLPIRFVRVGDDAGRSISVAIGPVAPGGPELALWKVHVEIG